MPDLPEPKRGGGGRGGGVRDVLLDLLKPKLVLTCLLLARKRTLLSLFCWRSLLPGDVDVSGFSGDGLGLGLCVCRNRGLMKHNAPLD